MNDYSKHISLKNKIIDLCYQEGLSTLRDIHIIMNMFYPEPFVLDEDGAYYYKDKIYSSINNLPLDGIKSLYNKEKSLAKIWG